MMLENKTDKNPYMELEIDGMTCTMCSQAVYRAIMSKYGDLIERCSINPLSGRGYVELNYHPAVGDNDHPLTVQQVCDEVEDAGYGCKALLFNNHLPPHLKPSSSNDDHDHEHNINMDCNINVNVNEAIEFNDYDDDMESSHLHLESQRQSQNVRNKRNAFLSSLIGSLPIFFLSMIYPHIITNNDHNNNDSSSSLSIESIVMWILATYVQFYCGRVFYIGAYQGMRQCIFGMDVLVCVGTTAAYFYAVLLLLLSLSHDNHNNDHSNNNNHSNGAHFFETSAVLISFVFLGHWLQAMAIKRTSHAILHLLNLQSKTAIHIVPRNLNADITVFDPTNVEEYAYEECTIATRDLQRDMLIKIIRGSGVPTDCTLVYGTVLINEASMTGESVPVLKSLSPDNDDDDDNADNDVTLLGGTICVEGVAYAMVSEVGRRTALSQIIQLMRQAQLSVAPIQDFADRVSAVFVPFVCSISVMTFITWLLVLTYTNVPDYVLDDGDNDVITLSLLFAISVLVISCPCALGLATPTAVMVGTGVGAQLGILLKGGGEALQMASECTTVVLDKTGTLTLGAPRVTCVHMLPCNSSCHYSMQQVLWYVATMERNSEHPLAQAIVRYYTDTYITAANVSSNADSSRTLYDTLGECDASSFTAVTGKGASGTVQGTSVSVGNMKYMQMMMHDNNNDVVTSTLLEDLSSKGMTPILCSINGSVTAVLGLTDIIRSDAKAAVDMLQRGMNIEVYMVTGDNDRTARVVAHELGIPSNRVVSEAMPVTKVQIVRQLQQQGSVVVAMVGDGMNDAPALAEANIGMAVSSSSSSNSTNNSHNNSSAMEIAAEAADIVLLNDKQSVWQVVVALHMSRVIFRRIKLNYLWALLYNTLGIPIAAGVFYPIFRWKLEPLLASLAMALSSVSVVVSSLMLKFYVPPKLDLDRNTISMDVN